MKISLVIHCDWLQKRLQTVFFLCIWAPCYDSLLDLVTCSGQYATDLGAQAELIQCFHLGAYLLSAFGSPVTTKMLT